MNLHINKPYGNLRQVTNSRGRSFFEAVFFDMDGLMVDSEPLWMASGKEITSNYGYEWSDGDQVACLGGPLSRVGQYMFERCNGVQSPEYFTEKLIEIQSEKLFEKIPLMPGAIELAHELQDRGVSIALVSASPRRIVDAVLVNLESNPFLFSISCDDVVNTKPHPDAYLLAAEMCHAQISHSLIFEDSLTGAASAKASGAWLIAVPQLVVVSESERVRSIKSLTLLSISKLEELFYDFGAPI